MTPPNAERIELTHRPHSGSPETLLYYDGPLVFWLPVPGRRLLAYALQLLLEKSEGEVRWRWPYIVVEVSAEAVAALEAGTQHLRQLVLDAQTRYLLPDYSACELILERIDTPLPDDWLPGEAYLPRGVD
jgi:hypothetical protein